MRVLLATYGSRGDVEPLAGLAVQLRALDWVDIRGHHAGARSSSARIAASAGSAAEPAGSPKAAARS
jgi:vancomycin aglycone glucosyltransferase